MVPNPAAHEKIWVEVLGGQASGNAPIRFVKLPGTFLILSWGTPRKGPGARRWIILRSR